MTLREYLRETESGAALRDPVCGLLAVVTMAAPVPAMVFCGRWVAFGRWSDLFFGEAAVVAYFLSSITYLARARRLRAEGKLQ